MNRWALAALVLCACGGVCPDDDDVSRPVAAGTYVLAPNPFECTGAPIAPLAADSEQHQLTISPDRTEVTEQYIRDGKSVRVVYAVTKTQRF